MSDWLNFGGGLGESFSVPDTYASFVGPSFDFSADNPAWGGWGGGGDEASIFGPIGAGYAAAPPLADLTYDTTTGAVFGRGGQPLLGDTSGGYTLTGAARSPLGESAPLRLDDRLGWRPSDALADFDRAGGGGGDWWASTNRFLGSPAGQLASGFGLGLLGYGAQRLFAGDTPTYRAPTYTPSRATTAADTVLSRALEGPGGQALSDTFAIGAGGERGLTGQVGARIGRETGAETQAAPYEEAARLIALQQVPGLLTPGPDPIQEGLRQELLDVLNNNSTGVSPVTERRQRKEEDTERARLYRQLGPDYELTTPGLESLRNLRERHNDEQYTERQATLARLSPLETSRGQSNAGIRRGQLSDAGTYSTFGLRGTPQNVSALSQLVPINRLFAGNPDEAGRINTAYEAQAGLERYRGDLRRDENLSRGIGGLFGTVAGTLAGQGRNRHEDPYAYPVP